MYGEQMSVAQEIGLCIQQAINIQVPRYTFLSDSGNMWRLPAKIYKRKISGNSENHKFLRRHIVFLLRPLGQKIINWFRESGAHQAFHTLSGNPLYVEMKSLYLL